MNFINPYIEFYFADDEIKSDNNIKFHKEVSWTFLKNINNRLKLNRHRLNIEFVNEKPLHETIKFGSIFIYQLKLEKPFNEIIESEKRRKLLDIIYTAFLKLGVVNNWDLEIIEDAYLKSLEEIDHFEYSTEIKLQKNKQYYGQLKLTLVKNKLTFNAEIIDLTNHSNKIYKLLETNEDNLSWNKMFKDVGWLDNDRFGLKFLNGDLWIVVNMVTEQVEELIRPKKFDLKKIEELLLAINKPPYKLN